MASLDNIYKEVGTLETAADQMIKRHPGSVLETTYYPALKKLKDASVPLAQDTGIAATRIAADNPNPVSVKQTSMGASNKLFKPEQPKKPSSPDINNDQTAPRTPGMGK